MDNGKLWLAPLTGIVFVVLAIVSFEFSGEPPDLDEGAQELVTFYTDNDSDIMYGSALQTVAAAFFVFFSGYLYRVLKSAPGASGAAALVTFAGSVIFAVGIAIDATINFALAESVEDIDPTSVQALAALWQNDFFPFIQGAQVFLIGFAVSVIRRGALPKWMGWVALVLAIVGMVPAEPAFVAIPGMGVLVLIMSVLLAMRARSSDASPA